MSIGSGSDLKIFPRRNEVLGRPPYDANSTLPVERKASKVLKLKKMILWVGSLVLLAGDISPHPGPEAANFNSENPGFNVKLEV